MIALYIIGGIIGVLILSQVIMRLMVKVFNYSPPVSAATSPILDSNFRQIIQPPSKIIKASGLKQGMKVVDLGCGSGAYTMEIAKALGEGSELYAVDLQEEMLRGLEDKLSETNGVNMADVSAFVGDAEDLPFNDDSIDMLFVTSTFQEFPDKESALKEIKRVLKDTGSLVISEVAFDIDYYMQSTICKMARKAGFHLYNIDGNFWNYTARFIK